MTDGRYTKPAIWLHWIIALGIVANVLLAWIWPYVADADVRPMIDRHKAIGLTVLGLAVLRLLWRMTHRPPAFPADYQPWERATAHVVHWGLYAVLFAMPLTGWIMDSAYEHAATTPLTWFGLFDLPRLGFIMDLPPDQKKSVHDTFGAAHGLIAWAIYGLFVLHVTGALKHQFDGHREVQRMGLGPRVRLTASAGTRFLPCGATV